MTNNTLSLVEAAKMLHMCPERLRQKTKLGIIPGCKPGRAWIFLEEDLVSYIRNSYIANDAIMHRGLDQCQLVKRKIVLTTTQDSASTELECKNLREQLRREKRNATKNIEKEK